MRAAALHPPLQIAMPARRQVVSTYQPRQYRAFDQQFWPVFMALCITGTILAATVVTLLTGFWMWEIGRCGPV